MAKYDERDVEIELTTSAQFGVQTLLLAITMRSLSYLTTLILSICVASISLSNMQVHGSDTSEQLAFYETHIRPLLSRRCYQCHSDRADKREGGLRLDDRDAMMGGGDSGLAIMPGDIDQSLLVKAIRYADTDLQMPPTEKLPAEDIAKIETWIRLGAIQCHSE